MPLGQTFKILFFADFLTSLGNFFEKCFHLRAYGTYQFNFSSHSRLKLRDFFAAKPFQNLFSFIAFLGRNVLKNRIFS